MSNATSSDAPITVFHVRNSNYPGGIETTLYGWFKYADRQRFNPRLQVFHERRGIHQRSVALLEQQGIDCEMLPWDYIRNLPGAVSTLSRRVRESNNPILHSHDTRSDLVALIVARKTGAPWVVSNHAWHPADFKRKVLESIRVRLMHSADKIISVSKNTHLETLERGLPENRCVAMYSGIDLEPYRSAPSREEARRRLGLEQSSFIIGNMARLWPEKQQDKLIDVAALVAERYPKMRFLIIGDGPLEQSLKDQVRAQGLEKIVFLPGFYDDFVEGLAALDVFALPSSAEGTPMVIYSAMAMGIPIVASPVSGVGEILKHGESALLVPTSDTQGLADSVISIYEDPNLASTLGENAKSTCQINYSAESAVRNLESIYTALLWPARPPSA